MGNCQSHTETTTVQPGSRTRGPVKHKGDCLSQRTKGCVSLRGIPISPLTACVYSRLCGVKRWCGKGKRRKLSNGKGERKTSVRGDACVCEVWACMCFNVCYVWDWMLIFRGVWGPCSVSMSLFQRAQSCLNTHKHWDNRHLKSSNKHFVVIFAKRLSAAKVLTFEDPLKATWTAVTSTCCKLGVNRPTANRQTRTHQPAHTHTASHIHEPVRKYTKQHFEHLLVQL